MAKISSSTSAAPIRPQAHVRRSIPSMTLTIEHQGRAAAPGANLPILLQLRAIERGVLPALHEFALAGQHFLEPAAQLRHGAVFPSPGLVLRGLNESVIDDHDLVAGLLELRERIDVPVVELEPGIEGGQLARELQHLLLAVGEAVPGRLAEHALLRRGRLMDT